MYYVSSLYFFHEIKIIIESYIKQVLSKVNRFDYFSKRRKNKFEKTIKN